jgi:nucleoid-associated protein YgaU
MSGSAAQVSPRADSRESMSQLRPSRRALSRLQIIAACALICASFFPAASAANAQDVAEAARQEKARKTVQSQKQQSHVYTNEDLQRSQILTPEDRTVVEARKKNAVPPAVNETSPANAPAQEATATESLGEIARRLRKEKAASQAEQARKVPPPAPFPMELPHNTILAHPQPLNPALIAPPSSASKFIKPFAPAGSTKRDPFSRATISAAPRSNSISAPLPISKSISPPTPVPPSVVVPPDTMHSSPLVSKNHSDSVQIQLGDSLWNLSRQYLGKGSRWQEFLSPNPGLGDPRRLQPGTVLLLPSSARKLETATSHSGDAPLAQPSGSISVQPGDSLWRIAAKQFGGGENWHCLARANPTIRDVDRIYPGQTLLLPASCASAPVASPVE